MEPFFDDFVFLFSPFNFGKSIAGNYSVRALRIPWLIARIVDRKGGMDVLIQAFLTEQ